MDFQQAQKVSYAVAEARYTARVDPEHPTFRKPHFPTVGKFDGQLRFPVDV